MTTTNRPVLAGNDFDHDRIRQALQLVSSVLRDGAEVEDELVFRMLLPDFEVNGTKLSSEHNTQLDELIAIGSRFRALRIFEIVGRASRTGNELNNLQLSDSRARAVSQYLTERLRTDQLGEVIVKGIGSKEPILDVGPVEEALNRSAEVLFAFNHVPKFENTDPTPQWSIVLGQSTEWFFSGSQKFTLIRDDTGEQRAGTFRYADLSLSPSPWSLTKKLFGKSGVEFDKILEEAKKLGPRWHRWLSDLVLELIGSLSVMPTDDPAEPRKLVVGASVGWDAFDGAPTFVLAPFSGKAPVGEIDYSFLIFGCPTPFAGCQGPKASLGLGSLFPELSTGWKVGVFELD
ncbi:OmpA family protein [Kocuria kalidii]|uniref:OmpA family protein n=1 Tax=Kocuria kalidii TaxID=3376283 RepID=UPI00379D5A1D